MSRSRSHRDGSAASPTVTDGLQRTWLTYDRRDFADILVDWMVRSAGGDPRRFVRELGAEQALSPEDMTAIVSRAKVPARELIGYLAARVPREVASPLVLRRRGEQALARNETGLPLVSLDDAFLARSRTSAMRSILEENPGAAGASPPGPNGNDFEQELIERIIALSGRDDIDPEQTLSGLCRFVRIDPETLRGMKPLLPELARSKAEELAAALGFEGDAFDEFADRAAQLLESGRALREPASLMLRLLRSYLGVTQSEMAARCGFQVAEYVSFEHGAPLSAGAIGAITRAAGLSDEERGLLSEAARHCQGGSNVEGVVKRFAAEGLTTEAYLRAAQKRSQLFCQKPETIAANITGVVDRFAGDGLTRKDYLQAALRQPSLFTMRPGTVARHIDGLVERFAADGLTTRDYLRAALRQPQLFCQDPETIAANIAGVVDRFAGDGLTRKDYLSAALRQPPLFYQSPETIARHINIVLGFAEDGIFTPPRPRRANTSAIAAAGRDHPRAAAIAFLVANPFLLCLAADNLGLREAHRRLAGGPCNGRFFTVTRHSVERDLMRHLGHGDPEQPVPLSGVDADTARPTEEQARRFLLRALMHEGLIRSGTLVR
jgi:transcriptional regulator with XRE-family HTH domain